MDLYNDTERFFQENGIYDVNLNSFSECNLIIGKNGSGKTRFLKALEKEKSVKNDNVVVTLYFPEIKAFFTAYDKPQISSEDTDYFTVDLLTEDTKLNFGDFLKRVENDKGEFLTSLLQMQYIVNSKASRKATKALRNLNKMLADFLEKEIVIDSEGQNVLIKRLNHSGDDRCKEYNEALEEFSPGELMIFYLCIFLTVIANNVTEKIVLIMDEPEAHLHPKTLINFIQTLKDSKHIVELWVASHSLFLVPLFSFQEIIFLDHDHVIKHNSNLYKELYKTLVGLENIDVLEFLKSIDNWQYYRYIAECFCHPTVVGQANANDPQFLKLMESIELLKTNRTLKLLDYGAGEFRIWECLNLIGKSQLDSNAISYVAYEPYPKDNTEQTFKLYTDFKDMIRDKEEYDVVVLMNVLHEIEAKDWVDTFRKIDAVLSENGILVFLEVFSLNNGEQPYGNNGYLILQDEQVKVLFNNENIQSASKSRSEKTNCWIIRKEQIKKVNKETVCKSIQDLFKWCDEELRVAYEERIRLAHTEKDSSKKQQSARRYAFLSQQYLNAMFALEDLQTRSHLVASNKNTSPKAAKIVVKAVKNT